MSVQGSFASPLLLTAVLSLVLGGCGSDKTDTQGTGGIGGAGGVGAGGAGGATAGGTPGTGGGIPTGTGGAPTQCSGVAGTCQSSLDCCDGMTCNNTSGVLELNGCHPRCKQSSECQTGCCLLYEGASSGICAEQKWCACGVTDATCGGSSPACCADQVCLAKDQAATSYACRKRCQGNADCPTNCCVDLPNLDTKACLDPVYCGVAP